MERNELIITTAKELTLAAISNKMIISNSGSGKAAAVAINECFAEIVKNVKAQLDQAQ